MRAAMHGKSASHSVSLDRLSFGDSDMVFGWRNLPRIVELSGSGRTVSAAEHAEWFARAVVDPDRILFKIMIDGRASGLLRFDRDDADGGRALVSIYLLPGHSGAAAGTRAFEGGLRKLRKEWPDVVVLRADVLSDNVAALAFFRRLGFEDTGTLPGTRALVKLNLDLSKEGHS